MNRFGMIATATLFSIAGSLAFTPASFAQGDGCGGCEGGGPGASGPGGAPDRNPVVTFIPPTRAPNFPPEIEIPVNSQVPKADQTCEYIRLKINANNALFMTPRYRECLRRNGQL